MNQVSNRMVEKILVCEYAWVNFCLIRCNHYLNLPQLFYVA